MYMKTKEVKDAILPCHQTLGILQI